MAYRDLQPLDAARTDSHWSQTIVLCDGDALHPRDLTGWTADVTLVRRGLPSDGLRLTLGAGVTALGASGAITWDATLAQMAARIPGPFDVEVRAAAPGDELAAVYVGWVPINQGLLPLLTAPLAAAPQLNGGDRGTIYVVATATGDTVLSGVGPRGAAADQDAVFSFIGPITAGELLWAGRWPRATTVSLAASYAYAAGAPASQRVLQFTRNGAAWITATWAIGANDGVLAGAAPSLAPGDLVQVTAPNTDDPQFTDIGITLVSA